MEGKEKVKRTVSTSLAAGASLRLRILSGFYKLNIKILQKFAVVYLHMSEGHHGNFETPKIPSGIAEGGAPLTAQPKVTGGEHVRPNVASGHDARLSSLSREPNETAHLAAIRKRLGESYTGETGRAKTGTGEYPAEAQEQNEFTPEQQHLIAMGDIGAKLALLEIHPEDRQEIFEKLAQNPEATIKVGGAHMATTSFTPVGSQADSPAVDSLASLAYTRAGVAFLP
jgi:hypothetical protein